ncbi:MAG TPA: response regulator transcription factor [Streptosporangiaceae bacterium]|nr:response regulator transcription factor [Streptosporangiaceae bacterium]
MGVAIVESPTRVLIAAERRPTRARLRLALEGDASCSEAENADAAVAAAVRERPDVCFLGLKAGANRLRATAEIALRAPSVAVIVLTNRPDEDEFMAAMRGGAAGYLPQSLDPDRLPDVVRSTLRGEPAVPRRFVARLLAELRHETQARRTFVRIGKERVPLTIRESEVVELLRRGASTAEISGELHIAPVTVRRHIGSIERKLGVSNRAGVMRLLRDTPVAFTTTERV